MNELVFPNVFNNTVGLAIKIFQIILLVLFIFYSFLTIRQVDLMVNSLQTKFRFEIRLAAYFQLFLGIGVLILILFS